MNKFSITVFTPTFNRAKLLPRLYQSLLSQNIKDFEWLIIDDGSTDGTRAVVQEYIDQGKIKIRYYYKENGGKHTAINFGVQKAEGKLFFVVDNDDWLNDNALHTLNHAWVNIEKIPEIGGVIGLSAYTNGSVIGDRFPHDRWEVSFADVYLKYHLKGDKAVAFKTDILRMYPFPEQEDIRFVFEAVVWHEMAKTHKIIALNCILQMKEYLPEGLTDSSYKKWYVRSLAFSYFNLITNQTYSPARYPKAYIWNFIHLAINSLLSDTSYFSQLSFRDKLLYIIFYPRAYYSYRNMKKLVHD